MIDQPKTITRDELEAAVKVATETILKAADEVFGKAPKGKERHGKETYRLAPATIAFRFRDSNENSFEIHDIFDHIITFVTPKKTVPDGKVIRKEEEHIREFIAGAQHLLKALNLQKQYAEYTRFKESIEHAKS